MTLSRNAPVILAGLIALGGPALAPLPAVASEDAGHGAHAAVLPAARPATPAPGSGPVAASISVENFAIVERAPVRNGFAPFTIEATGLLPMPRKRESFTPTEDEHFYTLRRTVERFLQRKEVPVGWSRSNEAAVPFGNELSHLRRADGIAYAVEGEMVVRGTSPLPLGLSITGPTDGPPLRFSAGLMMADQAVMMTEGMLDAKTPKASWMAAIRPSGEDAAVPVRAVFAVRAEGEDMEANRKALAEVRAVLTASADGRPATAERSNDASEWLKPIKVYLKPGQMPGEGGKDGEKAGKKADKKAEGGGHH